MHDGYDFAPHTQAVAGHSMHYIDEGEGETLLMLHGNPTWSYLYRHFIHDLRRDYRCVAPDHLGFGLSDKPDGLDLSMRAHINRLEEFVERMDLRDITVVVQDWGGIIGLGWAVRNKHRIKRMVIMNTTGFVPDPSQIRNMRPPPWGLALLWILKLPGVGELFVQGMNGFVRVLIPFATHHKERLTPEVMAGYLAPYPTWSSRRAHLESVRQVPMTPRSPTWKLLQEIDAELTGWEVPTQLIWGMRDPVFVPWFLKQFEARLPNHAPSVHIHDASHFLQDDTPEPIIAAIRRFVQPARDSADEGGREGRRQTQGSRPSAAAPQEVRWTGTSAH